MSQSKWIQWGSFLWPQSLYSGVSNNQSLELHLVQGRLRLQVDDAIYSYDDRYHIFVDGFAKVKLDGIQKVLVLGYGLGSIPFILENKHGLILQYTGVEYDARIIALAQKYSNPRFQSKIGMLQVDAQVFVAKNRQKYDLVCVDIFEGSQVPAFAKQVNFLEGVGQSLAENGLLVFNYMKSDKEEYAAFLKRFLTVFPQGASIDLGSNYMLVNKQERIK